MNYQELFQNAKPIDQFSYIMAYITAALLFSFPVIIISIVVINFRKEGKLNDQFKKKYKILILDLNT